MVAKLPANPYNPAIHIDTLIYIYFFRIPMAIHKLVYLPDPVLRKVAEKVDNIDQDLQTLLDDMFETMYDAKGVGLAAPQIGISKQIAVIDVTKDRSQQFVLINPQVIEVKGEETMQEGCLSVPGVYDTVKRASWVKMRALDRDGNEYELEGDGLLGEAIQHEIDHLNGKLFVDLLSPLKRNRAKKKLDKFKRATRQKDA